jgi:hypothetical protein
MADGLLGGFRSQWGISAPVCFASWNILASGVVFGCAIWPKIDGFSVPVRAKNQKLPQNHQFLIASLG